MEYLIFVAAAFFVVKIILNYIYREYERSVEVRIADDVLSDIDSDKLEKIVDSFSSKYKISYKLSLKDPLIEKEINTIYCENCKLDTLVLRKGRFGEFYGCLNYPRCRFTKGINHESI